MISLRRGRNAYLSLSSQFLNVPSRWTVALFGLVVLVLGLRLGLLGWSYPVTTCVSVQGSEQSCTTDSVDSVTAIVLTVSGVVGVIIGGKTLWNVR